MQRPPLTRRRALTGGLGALAATGTLGPLTSGCSAPYDTVASDATRLRFWHLFGGGDGVTMTAMLADFRAAHPGIALEDTVLKWGAPYYTKLGMAGAGGRAPELAVLHLARLAGFGPGTLLDPFDLGLLAELGVRASDFPPDIWRRGQVAGRQYAVPLDTHPVVLYYQTEICEQAGLLADDGTLKPLRSPEEFADALRAAKEVTGRPGLVTETLGPDCITPWRLFSTFYAQTGARVLSADGARLALDEEKALRVLEFMASLGEEGLWMRRADYVSSVGLFGNGDIGFHLNGEWEISTFTTSGIPFSMTPVPTLFGTPAAQADCHAFVLPHQRDRGGPGDRAAHTLVAWLLKHSVDWAEGGHVPAYTPVLDDPAYLELEPQSAYRDVIDHVALDAPAWFTGSASRMWIELGAVFSGVLTGARSPRNAVAEAKKRLRTLLDTPNPLPGAAS
ncbi:extracellular solute-binding protein [Streptomyces sp. JJ36]|uniref:extracellular solute-binding protein n=1 Tax=Streptomyces sp. JJ36 TaxID=2736645 RepID=UPI001F41F1AB|nr:extracellular solute-binding protein [Streptomyces sp. JJ36]MCF6521635.1 extracellular solute-binding protein [Streptomyces sp. JJ36]